MTQVQLTDLWGDKHLHTFRYRWVAVTFAWLAANMLPMFVQVKDVE